MAPARLQRKLEVSGDGPVEQAVGRGPVIVLGSHAGPNLHTLVLRGLGAVPLVLTDPAVFRAITDYRGGGPFGYTPRHLRRLRNDTAMVVSGRGERALVRHIRNGKAVIMHLDVPQQRGVEIPIGHCRVKLSRFPFRVALRYGAPVFASLFRKNPDGAYRLEYHPLDSSGDPDEGVRRYGALLNNQILEDPTSWSLLPFLDGWARWNGEA